MAMTREAAVLAALDSVERDLTGDAFAEVRRSPFGLGLAMFLSGARKHPADFYNQVKGFREVVDRFITAVDKMTED